MRETTPIGDMPNLHLSKKRTGPQQMKRAANQSVDRPLFYRSTYCCRIVTDGEESVLVMHAVFDEVITMQVWTVCPLSVVDNVP
jgi:hypothetical protein